MEPLTIRITDDAVISHLQERAAAHRQSIDEEAQDLLRGAAVSLPEAAIDAKAWIADAETFAARIGPLPGPDSTDLLRRLRYGPEEL